MWIKAARKAFDAFPKGARVDILEVLTIAAEGDRAVKPMKSFGSGIFEVALKYHTDAYRTVYALRLGDNIVTSRPPVFISRCCKFVSDQLLILCGSPSRRHKLPRL